MENFYTTEKKSMDMFDRGQIWQFGFVRTHPDFFGTELYGKCETPVTMCPVRMCQAKPRQMETRLRWYLGQESKEKPG